MIAADQPTIFNSAVNAAVSEVRDGNMRFSDGDDGAVRKNREAFLAAAGIDPRHTSLVRITYDADDYARYRIVRESDKGKGVISGEEVEPADALVTDQPNHALFLLLADCVGAVLYDSEHHVLMVSHLGRHSVEIDGAVKSVQYLQRHFSSNPSRVKVWLSPGVGSASYPLKAFDGKGLHEVITSQLIRAGVKESHIENDAINTAASERYYSHSEFLKGNETGPARFAIVAEMRERGEPAS